MPLSQVESTFPVLKNPANRHKAVGFTPEQWHYAFTNTFTEEESRRLYERYHIPASGRIFWGSVLANIHPGHDDTWVDYHNEDRAPLLFISGSEDHIMPPKVQRSNAKHYKAAGTITEVKEFEGTAPAARPGRAGRRSPTTRSTGPRATRDARRRTRPPAVTDVRVTHIGGPTVLIEVAGWRLLTDPTFDPPGRSYTSAGDVVAQARRARRSPPTDLGPIDAVLLTHDHHADNLDDAGRALLPAAGTRHHHRLRRGAARRQRRGLAPWDDDAARAPGRPPIEVTATPCRHGPPLSRRSSAT